MGNGNAVIAYLHPGEVAHSFHKSLLAAWQHDLRHHRRLSRMIGEQCGAGRITDGRNQAVRKFLLGGDEEWLCFIDSDMGFDPDMIDRLIGAAYDPPNAEHPDASDPSLSRPIVGALAFGVRHGAPGLAGAIPTDQFATIYRRVDGQIAGYAPISTYPRNTLVECDATGAACFVVHRSVLEAMAGEFTSPREWFDEERVGSVVLGEDLTFFRRCQSLGYPVHVHTGVKTSHYKPLYLTEQTMPDPAAIPTFVVIPMRERLDLTRQLLDQLAEQDEYHTIFLLDNGSSEETKDELRRLTVPRVRLADAAGWNIHQMWNAGVEAARATAWPCNIAVLNNDLTLGPRFLSGLARVLRADPLMSVVSPNYDGRDPAGADVHLVGDVCAGRYDGTGGLAGFAFMLKGEGGYRFPEELAWWYGDNDLLAHVLVGGGKAGIVTGTHCEHVGGGAQTAGDWSTRAEQLERDRKWFHRKWGLAEVDERELAVADAR